MPCPLQHALASLLAPRSVALVGASEQPGSLGRTVLENLIAGGVPRHAVRRQSQSAQACSVGARTRRSRRSAKPVDLAVIATPAATIPDVLDDARGRLRAAVLLSFFDGDAAAARAWQRDSAAPPQRGTAFAWSAPARSASCAPTSVSTRRSARPSRCPDVLRSSRNRARCARRCSTSPARMSIGFSTVVSLGGGIDVGFGELLEALVHDPATDGILLYVESVGDARAFVSALRAGRAHQAGRRAEGRPFAGARVRRRCAGRVRRSRPTSCSTRRSSARAPSACAPTRSCSRRRASSRSDGFRAATGSRSCPTAAARACSPPTSARDAGVTLAQLGAGHGARARRAAAARDAARQSGRRARRCAARAVRGRGRRRCSPIPASMRWSRCTCRARSSVRSTPRMRSPTSARASTKPVLGAWLGAIDRPAGAAGAGGGWRRELLHAGECRRRVLVPRGVSPQPGVAARGAVVAAGSRAAGSRRRGSDPGDGAGGGSRRCCRPRRRSGCSRRSASRPRRCRVVTTLAQAQAAARRLRLPGDAHAGRRHAAVVERSGLAHGRALARAWRDLAAGRTAARRARREDRRAAIATARRGAARARSRSRPMRCSGPSWRPARASAASHAPRAPRRHAAAAQPPARDRPARPRPASRRSEALMRLLLQVSALACALPWVRGVALDPVIVGRDRAQITAARVARRSEAEAGAWLPAHGDPSLSGRARGTDHAAATAPRSRCGRSVPRTPSSSAASSPACPTRRATSASSIACTSSRRRCSAASRRSTTIASSRCSRSPPIADSPEGVAIVGDRALHREPRSRERGVRDRRRRCVAGARRGRAAHDSCSSRVRETKGSAAARRVPCFARTRACCASSQSLGFTIRDDPEDPEQVCLELVL